MLFFRIDSGGNAQEQLKILIIVYTVAAKQAGAAQGRAPRKGCRTFRHLSI